MDIDITTLDTEKFAYAWANQLGTLRYEPLHCSSISIGQE